MYKKILYPIKFEESSIYVNEAGTEEMVSLHEINVVKLLIVNTGMLRPIKE